MLQLLCLYNRKTYAQNASNNIIARYDWKGNLCICRLFIISTGNYHTSQSNVSCMPLSWGLGDEWLMGCKGKGLSKVVNYKDVVSWWVGRWRIVVPHCTQKQRLVKCTLIWIFYLILTRDDHLGFNVVRI